MLPQLQVPDGATMGDIVVPNAYTAQYNSLLTLLLKRSKKVTGSVGFSPRGAGPKQSAREAPRDLGETRATSNTSCTLDTIRC